jgi:2-polyprenyl-6-methoxyphenol hydroxylase-like FAD-dependent oxidoreductase
MARIVVSGAGVAGLTTAMLLARDGHEVTVFERDPAPPPDVDVDAWAAWERRGVNQFRLLHYFLPRFRALLETELPEVLKALIGAGAFRSNIVGDAPDSLTGGRRDGDGQYEVVTGRRPVVESVLATAAAETPGVTIRRGVAVAGLLTGPEAAARVPHVIGVVTEDGHDAHADLVVDTTGRRSPLPDMLQAAGARRPPEELDDCGFIYYGRHFRSADGSVPAALGPPLQECGTISVLALPADNGTWGLGLITSSRDTALRALRHADRWGAVARSLPLTAHWLDGEPLEEGVTVMAKIEDRHRSFTIDGRPLATGVVAVGDSWACTNPSVGRGASIALMHAVALRDLVRSGPADPAAFAAAWDAATTETVEPYYRGTLSFDRHRLDEIEAELEGRPFEADVEWELTKALALAATRDPDCFRAFLKVGTVLDTPEHVLADPAIAEKVVALGAGWRDEPRLGPGRSELLAMVEG